MQSRILGLLVATAVHGVGRSAVAVPHGEPVSAGEWSTLATAHCLVQERDWRESLEALRSYLSGAAQSQEHLQFPDEETRERRDWLELQRQSYFDRLNFLLRGEDARSLERSAERFRDALGPPGSSSQDPFRDSLQLLFAEATPCGLSALESTFAFATFGLPFTRDKLEQALDMEGLFAELDHAYHEQVELTGSVKGAYLALRPAAPEESFLYVSELVARLTGTSSAYVARAQADLKRRRITQEQIDEARARAVDDPGENALVKRLGAEAELRDLAKAFENFVRLAAEPVRLQIYTHSRVEELEGALRVNIPDKASDELFARVEDALYRDEAAIRLLQRRSAEETLSAVEPIIDRWFREVAVPSVAEALRKDPFSAYWFYVQTGMIARAPFAYEGSAIRLPSSAFTLERLRNLTPDQAIETLRRERIPDDFLDAHAHLEDSLTAVVMDAEEALRRIEESNLDDQTKERLRGYVKHPLESGPISTIDVYSWTIRDSNRVEGSVDWDLIRAALDIVHAAKRDKLREGIRAVAAARGADEAQRLSGYLDSAASLMLELEKNQATEDRFQEAWGGAVIGWFLKQFLIGGGVPVKLWVPDGVTGEEFEELIDELTRNRKAASSGDDKKGTSATKVELVLDGRNYHDALRGVINGARDFLNVSQFSWTLDTGGKEVAYRLMGKKLGLDGAAYEDFLHHFCDGIALEPGAAERLLLYDVPTARMKNLLFFYYFKTTSEASVADARERVERALGEEIACPSVATCGDLSALFARAGKKFNAGVEEPGYQEAWVAFQALDALFSGEAPALRRVKPRRSLAEYIEDGDDLRRFVRRHGKKREDDPSEPFPVNVFADGKNNLTSKRFFKTSSAFPYFYQDPLRDLYYPMMELDVRVLLWKDPLCEFPFHLGPIPFPGRKYGGILPFPFIPYPWLSLVFPGIGWKAALILQWLAVSDPRNWWAMSNHTKNVSSESAAIESGMGFATKYFNGYPGFNQWHDTGVRVEGPIVGRVNETFVRMFNRARVNNTGLPGARGVKIPKLAVEDYRHRGEEASGDRSWVVTTDPEGKDYNYRGIFMAALAAARENIYIDNFYLSDRLVARMLIRKAREFRGRVECTGLSELECNEAKREAVRIHVVFPARSDQPRADALSTADRHEMLHLGIKIYQWSPRSGWASDRMLHTKAWMVDYVEESPTLTYVGTANLSQRSHLTDNEMGILSVSPGFAKEVQERLFDLDTSVDSYRENPENFHIVLSTNRAVRAVRWLQFFLVNLTWAF